MWPSVGGGTMLPSGRTGMMRGRKTTWLLGLVLVLAACGGDSPTEQFLETPDGIDNVDIGEDGESFTVTDEEGNTLSVTGDEDSLTITGDDGEAIGSFGGGELPDDFPIPTLPGSNVQSVIETPAGSLVIIEYSLDDYTYEEIVAFYDDFSSGDGITVAGRMVDENSPAFVTWFLQNGDEQYDITVHDQGNFALVQLSVDQNG